VLLLLLVVVVVVCALQGGELKPGSKGLNMNREEWQKLVAGMEALTAQL
jgi:hypothetical protein